MWPIFRVTLACAGQEGLGFEVLGFRLSLILGECEFKQGAFGRHHFRFCGGSHSLPGVCTYLCVFFRFEVQVPPNCCQTFLRETRWKPAVCQISAGKPIWKPAVCPHFGQTQAWPALLFLRLADVLRGVDGTLSAARTGRAGGVTGSERLGGCHGGWFQGRPKRTHVICRVRVHAKLLTHSVLIGEPKGCPL